MNQSEQAQATIDAKNIYIGQVKYGELIRDVRAPGNLVPNEKQWLSARTNARVVKRILLPGAQVDPNNVILVLESPDLVQQHKRAQLDLKVARAQLHALVEQQKTALQEQKASVKLLEIEKKQAIQDLSAKQKLHAEKVIPDYQYEEAVLRREQLTRQLEIEQFRLQRLPALQESLLNVEEARIAQLELQVELLTDQVDSLQVKAGMGGILQSVSVEVGQQVTMGTQLAEVASQKNLKAELRIQEGQVKDIQIGQSVIIDTRRSKIQGSVSRIDPAVVNGTVTVDVILPAQLPTEARPDLRVEGRVEIERLENVLLVDKPANWRQSSNAFLFKLEDETVAVKTPVTFGASSVSSVQLLTGINAGEKVILSDLSQYESVDKLDIY
ncbi:efflux RND transporter periplasmic adaptor subunit [Aliikangiella coralliicola]|uniref:efflux RND transporter periplasmic adaptor subunit n=1 Tax=Aliikangiella coralliicola TaxID=2592383 RepID=UPI00143D6387|nr:efflux RND transporter periplasmic adaptor subunit [Aliikangiella coralliicola]